MQPSQKRNFHVPLPDALYQFLSLEAERRRQPTTTLVREVLEEWVQRLRAQALHSEIANYAARHAGTSMDIDAELEAAGSRWRRRALERGRVAGGKICEIKATPPESGTQMRRGEVYWAQLVPRSGSEQRGRRPVIVVSHDGFNQTPAWRSIIVVPISTAAVQAQRGPTAVGLAAGAGGLPKQSIAICHQVTTLDKAKLVQRIGILDSQLLNLIDNGLKAALQLP